MCSEYLVPPLVGRAWVECWALKKLFRIERYLPVARDGSNLTVVHLEWDVETDDGVAGLDVLQDVCGDVGVLRCSGEEDLHILEETRLSVGIELTNVGGLGSSERSGVDHYKG